MAKGGSLNGKEATKEKSLEHQNGRKNTTSKNNYTCISFAII